MDGTLVDTEPYWIETEFELAEKYGGTWSQEHALNLVGNDLLESGATSASTWASTVEPEQIVEELLDGVVARVERQVPWQPGAASCWPRRQGGRAVRARHDELPALRRADPRRSCRPGRSRGGDRRRGATASRTPSPTSRPPPCSASTPEDCLAIEDSNTGVRSAVAAGCTVLVVPNHVPVLDGEGESSPTPSAGWPSPTSPGSSRNIGSGRISPPNSGQCAWKEHQSHSGFVGTPVAGHLGPADRRQIASTLRSVASRSASSGT
jgi:hypothetical protein